MGQSSISKVITPPRPELLLGFAPWGALLPPAWGGACPMLDQCTGWRALTYTCAKTCTFLQEPVPGVPIGASEEFFQSKGWIFVAATLKPALLWQCLCLQLLRVRERSDLEVSKCLSQLMTLVGKEPCKAAAHVLSSAGSCLRFHLHTGVVGDGSVW